MIDTSKQATRENMRASMHGPMRRRNAYVEVGRALAWGMLAGALAWPIMATAGGFIVGAAVSFGCWKRSRLKAQKGE